MARYIIEVDDCDLADMAVGRLLRECPESLERIALAGGAGSFIDEDERTAQMSVSHRVWLLRAISDDSVRLLCGMLAEAAREAAGETDEPWRD